MNRVPFSWLEVMQCERHVGVHWPHDNCPGPGMPLFKDLAELQGEVQNRLEKELEGASAVPPEAELYADETDGCLAQAAANHTTQKEQVMDQWSDRHDEQLDGSPLAVPKQFQKNLLVRRDELNSLIENTEDQLRAYRLELNMVGSALQAHDEYESTPTMATSSGNATRF